MRRLGALTMACALFARGAAAQTAEDKATARRLAIDGVDRAEANDCAAALPLLAKAESLFHAPIHLQYTARCLTRAGRLVEAAETWRRLAREPLPPDAGALVREAIEEARREIDKVEARLATLTVHAAVAYPGLTITLDGKPLALAALDVARVVDPGKHVLVARAPGHLESTQESVLVEGGRAAITIELEPKAPGAPEPVSSAAAPIMTGGAPVPREERPSSGLRTAGAVTAAAGAALVAGGVVTWIVRNGQRDQILADCPGLACTTDHTSQKTSVEHLTAATNALLLVGGGAMVVGVVLWAGVGSRDAGNGVALRVAPTASGGTFAVDGRF